MAAFKNLRKKLRRRRIETMLLAGYAFAVTCALFISLVNNNAVVKSGEQQMPEEYDYSSDVFTPAFTDVADNNPFENSSDEVYHIKLISDNEVIGEKFVMLHNENKEVVMPVMPKPKKFVQYGSLEGIYQKQRHVIMVESGDTFIGILNKLGMESKNATDAYNTLRKVYDTRNLRVGQYFVLTGIFNIQSHALETLETLAIEPERGTKYVLFTNEYDKFETKVEREKFLADVKVVSGSVIGTISGSLTQAGLPSRFANEVVRIFSQRINLNRDVHKGDKFEVKYEVSKTANGDVVKLGNLLSASFVSGKNVYKQYRYKNEYYDAKGQAKKTGLDNKPLAARNARVSSLFGYRRHPILKTTKFHSGVDYAAPRGTAIYASGNGVVEMARYVNGYGNFVKIKHNSEYETAYGHMQGYAKGIRPGVSVRKGQVIGYVGSTGRSTGPHLHFEIIRRGQRINPLKAQVATGNDLTGNQLAEFRRNMNRIDSLKEKIFKTAPKPLQISQNNLSDKDGENKGYKRVLPTAEELKQLINDKTQQKTVEAQANTVSLPTKPIEIVQNDIALTDENKAAVKQIETEVSANAAEQVKEVSYKGKILRPISISAAKARAMYLPSTKEQSARKIVMPVKKKPQPRRRTTSR